MVSNTAKVTFASQLKELRDELDMTQEEVAQTLRDAQVSISHRSYGEYERGKREPGKVKQKAILRTMREMIDAQAERKNSTSWDDMEHGDPEVPQIADEMGHPAKREQPKEPELQEATRHVAYELRDHAGDVQLRITLVIETGETKRETAGARMG